MAYQIKEIFKTLQGEGAHAGRTAVFCRFSGCNLWSGHEEDRESALCRFCDTDFIGTDGPGGGIFKDAKALADAILACWGAQTERRFVVFTGGEPLLQLDAPLLAAIHDQGFEIAIETNGVLPTIDGIDWICVSPKAGNRLRTQSGHELKLVYPQEGLDPESFSDLDFQHFWLQPMDGSTQKENIALAIAYCLQHPQWRLSLQTHKLIGMP